MEKQRTYYLLQQFANKQLTPLEREELRDITDGEDEQVLIELLYQMTEEAATVPHRVALTDLLPAIRQITSIDKDDRIKPVMKPAHRVHFLHSTWLRYAAAIIIVLGVGAYLWFNNNSSIPITAKNQQTSIQAKEVMPGSNKAILTLASGKKVELSEASNGRLIQPGDVEISTPKGGQYMVVLPDGTKAWLNAASSIKFPAAFSSKQRLVEITGESYLEVAPDKTKPFFVTLRKGQDKETTIQVLGTSFNVNAYEDEEANKITLLEGSIKITASANFSSSHPGKILKPGEAYINGKVIEDNIEQAVAWKNGWFSFTQADLPTVMRQLARWYKLEIVYEGKIPTMKFNGKIDRNLNLSQVLNGLARTRVKYRVEDGNKIVILSQ